MNKNISISNREIGYDESEMRDNKVQLEPGIRLFFELCGKLRVL